MAQVAPLLLLHHLQLLLLLGLVGGEPECRLPGQAATTNMWARVAALFENTNIRPQIGRQYLFTVCSSGLSTHTYHVK